jgi:superfamily II DNA or RNA helicase
MCVQSAYKHQGEYDLVIIDEAHRAASAKYRILFSNIKTKALMMLTATLPDNEENKEFLLSVAPVVFEKNLQEALEQELVPEFDVFNIPVPLHKSVSGKYKIFDAKFTQNLIKLTRHKMDNPLLSKYKSVFDIARAERNSTNKELADNCKGYWAGMSMRKQVVYNNPAKFQTVIDIIKMYPDKK